jgi:branched-chain amino acid transport system permease protein
MDPRIIQALLSGLALGSLYALVAQGYYITFTTTNTTNFAQGDFLMFGALIGLSVYMGTTLFPGSLLAALRTVLPGGFHPVIAIAVVILMLAGMGILLERIAIRPLRDMSSVGWIMSTVGVSVMLRGAAQVVWGPDPQRFVSPVRRLIESLNSTFGWKIEYIVRPIPRTGINWHEITVFFLSLLVMGGLVLFLRRTMLGKAMMAVAFNKPAAALMGINVRRITILAYMLSAGLAGLGGFMVAPIIDPNPTMGLAITVKAFSAAIIGGLDNPFGILVGGLLMGVTEQLVSQLIPGGAAWRDASVFVLIILLLAVRPTGLFGRRLVQKF